jgi:hypothetical protein
MLRRGNFNFLTTEMDMNYYDKLDQLEDELKDLSGDRRAERKELISNLRRELICLEVHPGHPIVIQRRIEKLLSNE